MNKQEELIINKLIELGWTPPKEKKQWEPKGGKYYINSHGKIISDASSIDYRVAGAERDSEEACELAAKRRRYNERLSALAHELGGEIKFKPNQENCYVYYDEVTRKYAAGYSYYIFFPERVYMTEECAKEICRMINDGEVEL